MAYKHIEVTSEDHIGIIQLDRPKALNAICKELCDEIKHALDMFEGDDNIGCLIVTGSEKAFAAGADIKEMQSRTYIEAYKADLFSGLKRLETFRKPTLAAVAGYALGGGCELAMMCDFIICADNAKFGQPEITLGTIPGLGGTQRLIRAIGKSKAMDLCLSGRMMDANEAERAGLVSRIVPAEELLDTAKETAVKIAAQSRPASMMIKESLNAAFETPLSQGLRFESRLFQSLFATEDQKEGMLAFIEKRKPHFKNK